MELGPDKDETRYVWRVVLVAVLALIAILFFACPKANAEVNSFAQVLTIKSDEPPCMLWHQDCGGYKTEFDMKSMGLRFGFEVNNILRIGYFDLGKYRTDAEATGDEACMGEHMDGTAVSVCPGPINRYVTIGSARGFSLSLIGRWHGLFLETGITRVRRSFQLYTANNVPPYDPMHERHNERIWGTGYMAGVGFDVSKRLSVGFYIFQDNLGGKMNNAEWPSGVGTSYAWALGITL